MRQRLIELWKLRFLSTLSLRRATAADMSTRREARISIHALLAESDLIEFRKLLYPGNFYPRSPCGERRARRASRQQPAGISIHALLAESDVMSTVKLAGPVLFLSTLSLRRATILGRVVVALRMSFLSTLSLRRATLFEYIQAGTGILFLSTLSLRRATIKPIIGKIDARNFYPRSPCGERLGRAFWPGLSL